MANSLSDTLFESVPYNPPTWLVEAVNPEVIPATKVQLGRFPTPYHAWKGLGDDAKGLDMYIKRDDLSSFDMGGNKIRKLQFLLAEAIEQGADTVVTIGATQSNHCRATAVATRQLGLDPYLILRTRGDAIDPPELMQTSLVGNLLFDKMVGAQIRTVSTELYTELGQVALVDQLCDQLRAEGKRPFGVPVGGSSPRGAFGYIDAMAEIVQQGIEFDHLIFSCGSGGTAAGLSIGARLCGIKNVHGIGVCDTPDIFYEHIQEISDSLGISQEKYGPAREWLTLHDGQGIGYGKSLPEELEFLQRVGRKTGILLDPVYSGKGLYYFLNKIVEENRDTFKPGQKVLFLHTGGVLGLYDKEVDISAIIQSTDPTQVCPMTIDSSKVSAKVAPLRNML